MKDGASAAVVFDESDFRSVSGENRRSCDRAGCGAASGVEVCVVGPVDRGRKAAAERRECSRVKLVIRNYARFRRATHQIGGEYHVVFRAVGCGGGVERKFCGIDREPSRAADGDAGGAASA